MRRFLPAILLVGCWSSAHQVDADKADSDTDVDTDATGSDTDTDTDVVWDSGLGDDTPGGGDDEPSLGDPHLGVTPLDGTWTGTYVYKEFLLGTLQAACFGEVTLTIDGDGFRHVSGQLPCTVWDPNFNLIPGNLESYGDVNGYAYATLSATDFSRFQLAVQLTAVNMQEWDQSVRIDVDGDAMTGRYDSRTLGTGQKFDIDLVRGE
ncbi:MAG: hypothetical protein H6733_11015 [Alphaproteobacteria bacterium]|nr:hypothetical protein [Alphaproteobacteria bacterium]